MKWLTLPLCTLALVACSGKPPAPQAAQATPRVATPLDQLKKDEQKARDVQKTIDDQAAEQRKQVDAAEQ
ncbi:MULTISPECIES: hypothetical protein [Dyella]|uniref:Lipoprotein n=2 Tax=Dyella TaxID=231454 RepID=A0A4R0YIQ4_9GAMM|nr:MULTISPECIES: hypothetical protein [Dyella]TBR36310.1 hypothetical protein EYV96_17155 [Dyella terrae]TCI05967.1 hypothetical protein EZM97_36245 [Dyella soli]